MHREHEKQKPASECTLRGEHAQHRHHNYQHIQHQHFWGKVVFSSFLCFTYVFDSPLLLIIV